MKNYTIPSSVTYLGYVSFHDSIKLEKVNNFGRIQEIGNWTFYNCSKLENIINPTSIISIGENAFDQCKKLKNILIPNVLTIDAGEF